MAKSFLATAREQRSFDALTIRLTQMCQRELTDTERDVLNNGYKDFLAPA